MRIARITSSTKAAPGTPGAASSYQYQKELSFSKNRKGGADTSPPRPLT